MSGEDSNQSNGDTKNTTDQKETKIITCRYTITMPLIPTFKTAVATYCRSPTSGVVGGFIRWQSMNTIYSIKLDCLCQGSPEALEGMPERIQGFAWKIWSQRCGTDERPAVHVSYEQADRYRIRHNNFFMGITPLKVMDVWRKERILVRENSMHAMSPSYSISSASIRNSSVSVRNSSASVRNSNSIRPSNYGSMAVNTGDTEHSIMTEDGEDLTSLEKERTVVHSLWLQEHKMTKTAGANSQNVVTWRPNSYSNNCNVCDAGFALWRRKHHCRRCGELVCSSCSPDTALGVPLLSAPPSVAQQIRQGIEQRICVRCARLATKSR